MNNSFGKKKVSKKGKEERMLCYYLGENIFYFLNYILLLLLGFLFSVVFEVHVRRARGFFAALIGWRRKYRLLRPESLPPT